MRADPSSFRRVMACVPILAAWLAAHAAVPSAQAPNAPPPAAPSLAAASLDFEAREKFLASARIIHEKVGTQGHDQHPPGDAERRHVHARCQRADHRRGESSLPGHPGHRAQLQGQLAVQRGRLPHRPSAGDRHDPRDGGAQFQREAGLVHLVGGRCADGRAGALPAEAGGAGHQRLERADVDHPPVRSADRQRRSQPRATCSSTSPTRSG